MAQRPTPDTADPTARHRRRQPTDQMTVHDPDMDTSPATPRPTDEMMGAIGFLDGLGDELEGVDEGLAAAPAYWMTLHLMRCHLEGKTVTPSALIGASRAPYGTANRRLAAMVEAGLIERRPRTRTGRSFSLHPSPELLERWSRFTVRLRRLAEAGLATPTAEGESDYYFGGSYMSAHTIGPLQVLSAPLKLAGGLRMLVHADPTFMVMENLSRQFEQVLGTSVQQRAFSIDRLREEALRNAERPTSRYDLVAVDLPWIGEFAEKGVLMPLGEALDLDRLDPPDFHTAGWQATHWAGQPYAVPTQTTPELLFWRRDRFAEAGLEAPRTTEQLLAAARYFHAPQRGSYGIAWNAARGTALGHTFLMTMADFGQPVLDLPVIAGGFNAMDMADRPRRAMIDSAGGLAAAEFLLELLSCSPPDILNMSWYERIRTYASGRVAIAYGYTLLAPYFESDARSPARGRTGYLPHPVGPGAAPVAPVGGYAMGIPANLPPERIDAATQALTVFTSPAAQKLFVEHGSRTNSRYSVGADPEVRAASPIFEAVDAMSVRDELQFWPRPPVPEIGDIVQACGEEFHDMLRGLQTPRQALGRAQARADAAIADKTRR